MQVKTPESTENASWKMNRIEITYPGNVVLEDVAQNQPRLSQMSHLVYTSR